MPTNDLTNEEIIPLLETLDQSLQFVNELTIKITEIPAPPFKEEERGKFIAKTFREYGYDVEIDQVGNVIASQNLKSSDQFVILSAHIDTVFPNKTIEVLQEGEIMKAPGVGDDSRGLANLLIIAKLLKKIKTKYALVFAATVGEEGLGDLRGVKALFRDSRFTPQTVRAFITIDGTGTSRIVDQGVGSIRYLLHFKGPGGHSYGSFGLVNPVFAAGIFLEHLAKHTVPKNPKTTYSVGTIEGGTSINSIPDRISMGVDMRSESREELNKLAKEVTEYANKAVEIENSLREDTVSYEIEEVGNRPAGKLPDNHWLREAIAEAHNTFEIPIEYGASSTDANVPLDKGIPAISVGGVADAGRAHSQDEWVRADAESLLPIKRNLLLTYLVCQR